VASRRRKRRPSSLCMSAACRSPLGNDLARAAGRGAAAKSERQGRSQRIESLHTLHPKGQPCTRSTDHCQEGVAAPPAA
jgi:hypothetical protein